MTEVAAKYTSFPGCDAEMTHVPTATKDTVVDDMVQTVGLADARLTVSPALDAAVTVYVVPPTVAPPGAEDVKDTV